MAELIEAQVSRYQEYKPTGVEWMPEIPVEWEMRKVGHSFHTIGSGTTPNTDNNLYYRDAEINWINTGDLNDGYLLETKKKVSKAALEELSALKVYPSGSLIVAMYGATIGKLAITAIEGCANQACAVLANSPIFSIRYAFYWFLASKQHILTLASGGGQPNINQELIRSLRMPCPTEEEQEAIISFLDEKTAQLDQLITQKQQMLALLREERAALINHAVTKGLDPQAPLRVSGVEWLGDVPAHWEVKRLKHLLVKLEQGWSPSCESRPAELGEWGVLKVGCVNGLDFDPTENKALPSELTPLPEYEINPGDFLISRANTKELVGSAVVVGEVRPKLLLCDKIFRLFFRENANKEYVLLIISSWYGRLQIQSESSGASSSMQNISQEFLKNMLILLPDRHEQHAIVEYVAEQTSRILETADTINQEIALLQEYRAALIAEAVTGQIDVRDYAPVAAALP